MPSQSHQPVARFESKHGVRIYRVTVEAFPGFFVHVYVILGAGPPTLVDTGSGFGECDRQLLDGIRQIRSEFNEPVDISNIRRVLITHGHIDHFGGLPAILAHTNASVGIHELDQSVLATNAERVALAKHGLRIFLRKAGVDAARCDQLMELYEYSKRNLSAISVEYSLADGTELDGLRFLHVPGHCPGQVCIELDDVLITADHILSRTTPHQSPESIMAYTGLGHYFDSLKKIAGIANRFRLALGGHEEPIEDLTGRIAQIQASHHRKLENVSKSLTDAAPMTIAALTRQIYPHATGFHELLALEEVGAHVEYLHERGKLVITNPAEIEGPDAFPFQYAAR